MNLVIGLLRTSLLAPVRADLGERLHEPRHEPGDHETEPGRARPVDNMCSVCLSVEHADCAALV